MASDSYSTPEPHREPYTILHLTCLDKAKLAHLTTMTIFSLKTWFPLAEQKSKGLLNSLFGFGMLFTEEDLKRSQGKSSREKGPLTRNLEVVSRNQGAGFGSKASLLVTVDEVLQDAGLSPLSCPPCSFLRFMCSGPIDRLAASAHTTNLFGHQDLCPCCCLLLWSPFPNIYWASLLFISQILAQRSHLRHFFLGNDRKFSCPCSLTEVIFYIIHLFPLKLFFTIWPLLFISFCSIYLLKWLQVLINRNTVCLFYCCISSTCIAED